MDENKTTKTNEIKLKSNDKKEIWDSGIKILKKMQVIIPLRLLLVCNQIADKMDGDEFSILANISEKENTELKLSEDYYIPKQIVSTASIAYQPDEYNFNTVIHRHPDGFNSFSTTDQNFINQNFLLSVLYTKSQGFVNGLYNLRHENGYLIQLPVEIFVDYGIDEIDISNIQKPAPLMIIDKPRKQKSKHDRKRDWDLDLPEHREKLFPEETMDYALMKDFMLDEINGEIQDLQYRINNLEESIYHNTGLGCENTPF